MIDTPLYESHFPTLNLFKRGKVRDVYDLGGQLLIVATDRLSAFDVIMPDPIPFKGFVLTQISNFWFDQLSDIVGHHLLATDVSDFPASCRPYREILDGRSILVKKTTPLPVECVARGYLSGSGWSEYSSTGSVCGIRLPEGLVESSRLPEPIFTPATKAEVGHDENISFERTSDIVGREKAALIRDLTLRIYQRACGVAGQKGIIIADTKMEFGESDGKIILIDELLTPDSSRFWPRTSYEPGKAQASFDKQFVRDYLLSIRFDKKPPGPALPSDIIRKTSDLYREALRLLTSREIRT
jgi:phosphoribosylaminoimidazole-succinocarboxamide synthase